MKNFGASFVILGAALVLSSGAMAKEITISQKGKKFSQRNITISSGDVLDLGNDDRVSHNVLIRGPGTRLNSGIQNPGKPYKYTFDKNGLFKVRCGIHPKMKLDVTVK